MATKKQRRRREKERRHEYEVVYLDEEGEEVEVDEAGAKPTKAEAGKPAGKSGGGQRTVDPPSWNKVLRRTAIFAPFILIFIYLTRPKDASAAAVVLPAILLVVLLVPFMYAVDSLVYRSHQKRMAKRGGPPPKSK